MFTMTRRIVTLAFTLAACSDGPSGLPATAHRGAPPQASIGGASGERAIEGIVAGLNAAWAAKDAAAYAAHFSEDIELINPVGAVFSGKAAFQAVHVFLFSGPFAPSTASFSVRRVRYLTGTIAILDLDLVITGFAFVPGGLTPTEPGVLRSRMRCVAMSRGASWEIVAMQLTPIAPAA